MNPLLLTLALLNGADSALTSHVIARGGREALLPSQSPIVLGAICVGETGAEAWGLTKLAVSHPKAAKVVGWALVGVRAGIVASNLHQAARR